MGRERKIERGEPYKRRKERVEIDNMNEEKSDRGLTSLIKDVHPSAKLMKQAHVDKDPSCVVLHEPCVSEKIINDDDLS